MTVLIGGSMLLIAVAAVALLSGWIGASAALVWISILASASSAVLLALAYYRSIAEPPSKRVQAPPRRPRRGPSSDRG